MSDAATPNDAPEALAAEQVKEPRKTPVPTAIGNGQVAIHNHSLCKACRDVRGGSFPARVDLAIGNETDKTIATIVLEAVFYDKEGNVVDTAKQKEYDLRPNRSRAVPILSSVTDIDVVTSYAVRVIRTSTADVEKVQLRRHEMTAVENGQDLVSGTVVNISQTKTDAALVATFYDANEENIGVAVLALRDIEPDTTRPFELRFKPQEGERVSRCTLDVGTITE